MFAKECSRGQATSCTGPDMAPHSNLAEHLIGVLNVICGRFLREGERIGNPGVLTPRMPRRAQVIPAPRPWEQGPKSRIGGYGMIDGEMVTAVMADEILRPGPGQVKALINHGGNPASSVPDQKKVVKAFRQLELLVSIEPYWTVTARLSHYILPPRLQYERADLPLWMFEQLIFPEPYTRYTPAAAAPPPGSEVADDYAIFWGLAKRLGHPLALFGVPLDMERQPSMDDILAILARNAPVPLDELKRHPRGALFEGEPQLVEPAEPGWAGRFTCMPDDVAAEMAEVLAEGAPAPLPGGLAVTHRLAVRRHRDVFNSTLRHLPTMRRRVPHNLAYLAPDDLAAHGLAAGDWIEITSDAGRIEAVAAEDPQLRPGVVSISHGFGGLPDADGATGDYLSEGVSINQLISTDRHLEPINAMPRMTAIPVHIRRSGRNDLGRHPTPSPAKRAMKDEAMPGA
jgi:anaerobic selenocysteine-containing dehydrogenase